MNVGAAELIVIFGLLAFVVVPVVVAIVFLVRRRGLDDSDPGPAYPSGWAVPPAAPPPPPGRSGPPPADAGPDPGPPST